MWTNAGEIEAMRRSQPLRVTWTGASSASQVYITGSSRSVGLTFPIETAVFVCTAEPDAGAFTVPQEVVSELIAAPESTPIPTGALAVGTAWFSNARIAGFDQSSVSYGDSTAKPVRVF